MPCLSKQNYYEMLNIDMNASLDTIKAAYRALVRRVHPDKLAYATPAEQAAGEEQAKNANNGYATLKDPVKRAEYDQTLPRPLLQVQKTRPRATPPSWPHPPFAAPGQSFKASWERPAPAPHPGRSRFSTPQAPSPWDREMADTEPALFPRPGTGQYARHGSRIQESSPVRPVQPVPPKNAPPVPPKNEPPIPPKNVRPIPPKTAQPVPEEPSTPSRPQEKAPKPKTPETPVNKSEERTKPPKAPTKDPQRTFSMADMVNAIAPGVNLTPEQFKDGYEHAVDGTPRPPETPPKQTYQSKEVTKAPKKDARDLDGTFIPRVVPDPCDLDLMAKDFARHPPWTPTKETDEPMGDGAEPDAFPDAFTCAPQEKAPYEQKESSKRKRADGDEEMKDADDTVDIETVFGVKDASSSFWRKRLMEPEIKRMTREYWQSKPKGFNNLFDDDSAAPPPKRQKATEPSQDTSSPPVTKPWRERLAGEYAKPKYAKYRKDNPEYRNWSTYTQYPQYLLDDAEPEPEPEPDHDALSRNGNTYSLDSNRWILSLTLSPKYEFVGDAVNVTAQNYYWQVDSSIINISLQFLLEEKPGYEAPSDGTKECDVPFKNDGISCGRGFSSINTLLHYPIAKVHPSQQPAKKPLRTFVLTLSSTIFSPRFSAPIMGTLDLETSATTQHPLQLPLNARYCATHNAYSRAEPDPYFRDATSLKSVFPRHRPEKRVQELPEMQFASTHRIEYADLRATEEYYYAGNKHGLVWHRMAACGWKKA